MSDVSFDFAIVGNSAFAAILALALARKHEAKVCLIGKIPAPLQIASDIALSFGPYSRPETLRLLAAATSDLRALLAGSGEPVLERRNVTIAALSGPGRTAAGHARHMLAAFGVVTSLLPETDQPGAFVAEGVWSLKPRIFFAGLPARLAEAGIAVIAEAEDLQAGRDIVRFAPDHGFASAKRLIVTDTEGIDALMAVPEILAPCWREAMLSEPVPGLAGTLLVDVESAGHVVGRADGRLEAVAPDTAGTKASSWLAAFLPPGTSTRIVARKRYRVLTSRDGAPVVTAPPHTAALIATGFGAGGAFFVPALARYLTGTASTEESAWFAARAAAGDRSHVADIGSVGGGTP